MQKDDTRPGYQPFPCLFVTKLIIGATFIWNTDDPTIFHAIPSTSLTPTDRCMICMDDFEVEAGSVNPANDAVRLPHCSGHGFHRSCLAQYGKGSCLSCLFHAATRQ